MNWKKAVWQILQLDFLVSDVWPSVCDEIGIAHRWTHCIGWFVRRFSLLPQPMKFNRISTILFK
jgi:hypothetical protein